jgi:hypothetical protein
MHRRVINQRSDLFLVKPMNVLRKLNVRQAPDSAEVNRAEEMLVEAVNSARSQYECGKCGSEEYDEALRRFNQFAVDKPPCEGETEDSFTRSPQLFCIRQRAPFPQIE